VIKFRCENCGQKFSVPAAHAGKKGKCPKCKKLLIVPVDTDADSSTAQTRPNEQQTEPEKSPYDLTLLDVPETAQARDHASSQDAVTVGTDQETQEVRKRRFPWIIDVLLYPISKPGLVTLAIIILIPLLFTFLGKTFTLAAAAFPPLLVFGALFVAVGFLARGVIGLYLFWYFCECIRDSAEGGLRAPETVGVAPGLWEMASQTLKAVCCFVLFVGPVGIYWHQAKGADIVLSVLLGYAVLFFPMGLLAVVMFDSLRGLNPILLIGSIVSTLLPYVAMLAVFVTVGYFMAQAEPPPGGSSVLSFVLHCFGIYLSLVAAHVLGWFYYRYQDQLNWEV